MSECLPRENAFMLPNELISILPKTDALVKAEVIGGSGSNRSYRRLYMKSGRELIGTVGTNRAENEAFIYLAAKLREAGVNVPEVLAVSDDNMAYVQTSVGNKSLFDCLDREDLIGETIDMLAKVQQTPDIDYSRCYPVAAMDRRAIMWDLNYFKYCFLKTTPGVEINEPELEDDFERLVDIIMAAKPTGFVVRDFQSRNIMIDSDGRPALIDFQGGRFGPAHYDVASFLWQARAGFSDELRSRMVSRFCSARAIDEAEFRSELPYFIALRLMQALGAYGFRGRFEGKEQFIKPIAPAVASLKSILSLLPVPLSAIEAHLQVL